MQEKTTRRTILEHGNSTFKWPYNIYLIGYLGCNRPLGSSAVSREGVLAVLERASSDAYFYTQFCQNCDAALSEYQLSPKENLAVRTGDVRWIESYTGSKIEPRVMENFFIPLLSREIY